MKNYKDIFDKNFDELLETLKKLIAIPSVVGDADGDAPFGKHVQAALEFMHEKAKADGFDFLNVDNYGGHIDFCGKSDKIVAMVNHLDVVPAGERSNWVSDPFDMQIRDGKAYGRGTLDNKGPLILCYYAMRALKEAGFEPAKTIRLILGCDEETAWHGMDYYMEHVSADISAGFSADADFPVIYGEKGIVHYKIHVPIDNHTDKKNDDPASPNTQTGSAETLPHLVSINGGSVMNAVPDKVTVKISTAECSNEALLPLYNSIKKYESYGVSILQDNDLMTIVMPGVTAHAAWPESGTNAVSRICEMLSDVEFDDPAVNEFFAFYEDHIGYELHGERMGCALEDEPSGKLTFNISTIESRPDEIVLGCDVRYPVTFTETNVRNGMSAILNPLGYKLETLKHQTALYRSPDDPIVATLMDVYKKNTGDAEAKPIAIGGGTYARAVPNTVAFGPVMPGTEDLCHQPNEFMALEQMRTAGHIFADALYELAKE